MSYGNPLAIMSISIQYYVVFFVFALAAAQNSLHPLSDEFISLINSKQGSWKAGRNFHQDTPLEYIRSLQGLLDDPQSSELPTRTHDSDLITGLPENFDAREKWPTCPSLSKIRDQASCGSCWAFGAVEAMTDRVCTYSNGTKNFHFSADDLLTCCNVCGRGCFGGYSSEAWSYWKSDGIVSGGPYHSSEGCRPYEFRPCEHHIDGPRPHCTKPTRTPACVQTCKAGNDIEYTQDKHYGKNVYKTEGEDNIKAEIFANGPVEGSFTVFEDFVHYKNGVYYHTVGAKLGRHAVKILGFGVENEVKYWLCANSWNSDWGDKGFFKIARDDMDSITYAGEPELEGL